MKPPGNGRCGVATVAVAILRRWVRLAQNNRPGITWEGGGKCVSCDDCECVSVCLGFRARQFEGERHKVGGLEKVLSIVVTRCLTQCSEVVISLRPKVHTRAKLRDDPMRPEPPHIFLPASGTIHPAIRLHARSKHGCRLACAKSTYDSHRRAPRRTTKHSRPRNMASIPHRPRCFLDVAIGTQPVGRLTVELFEDHTPRTAEK